MTNLFSWNCHSFMNKWDEIRDLISDHRPICFPLQETHLKNIDLVTIRGYSNFRKDFHSSDRAIGNVVFFIFYFQ